ncbi:MAG: ATP-grasp domain-containing protein [Bacteroides sp.]|nr:MAG: ATP-grasp domain-containing protein [Bacteroides sp.]
MKYKIALMIGGYSEENIISFQSGEHIYSILDKNKYDLYKIFVDKKGWYYFQKEMKKCFFINKNDFSLKILNQKILFDLVFILIHGEPGENGQIQAYLNIMNIPYIGPNYTNAVITINKRISKMLLKQSDIDNLYLPCDFYYNKDNNINYISKLIRYPFLIKPNNLGSSIGIQKIYNKKNLKKIIDISLLKYKDIYIEQYIKGREFSVSVFKNKDNDIIVLPITEIIHKRDFFDFQSKYKEITLKITPCKLPKIDIIKLQNISSKIYQFFNCNGIIRIDFILESYTKRWFYLEINTIPGLSPNSITTHQISKSKFSLKNMYEEMIENIISQHN